MTSKSANICREFGKNRFNAEMSTFELNAFCALELISGRYSFQLIIFNPNRYFKLLI